MPFAIDVNSPANDSIVALYPANERAHRTTMQSILQVEHDTATGYHTLQSGTTIQRDAITDWVVGSLWVNSDWGGLERVSSIGPVVWAPAIGTVTGLDADKAALTNVPNGIIFSAGDSGLAYIWTGTKWSLPLDATTMIDTDTVAASHSFASGAWAAIRRNGIPEDLECTVTVPDFGLWRIEIRYCMSAFMSGGGLGNDGSGTLRARLEDDQGVPVVTNIGLGRGGLTETAASNVNTTMPYSGVRNFYAPVLGATYSVKLEAFPTLSGGGSQYTVLGPVNGETVSWMDVLVLPYGT